MRIECGTWQELRENLVGIIGRGGTFYQEAVRVSVTKSVFNEASDEVSFHLTAIVREEGSEYLLQYSEVCGIDAPGNGGLEGTQRADWLRSQLAEMQIKILPGVLHVH